MQHILVALPLTEAQKARLTAAAPDLNYRFCTEETADLDGILWADAILGNVPVELIRQNRRLAWFQSNWAGPDAYLAPGVLPENCVVTNSTGAYGLAISEWMLGMWLGLLKDLFLYRDRQNRREWAPIARPVRCIEGAQVLCVGMGDIGSAFARRVHAMGAQVTGVRRRPAPCPDYCAAVITPDRLDEVLPGADLVALTLPGTEETRGLFDAARIDRMKPGAVLINVGRGTAVDTDALYAAVHSGRLSGAALDVTDPEPLPPDHPLWGEENVILTPHMSGRFSLPRTLDNIVDIFAHNLTRYAAGQTLDNQVSRTTRYVSGDAAGRRLCEGNY
ncbi:MAG: D-2-hydroxyacid dehydrogenase [Gemmiger sp.]